MSGEQADLMGITLKLESAALLIALSISGPGCVKQAPNQDIYPAVEPTPNGEVEATDFLGQKLTPIRMQRSNALTASKGTPVIDRASYRLTVDGLVDQPLSISYADLLAYPQTSKLMTLNCVNGWDFVAKWTGPTLNMIFDQAGVRPEATVAIFYTSDVPKRDHRPEAQRRHDAGQQGIPIPGRGGEEVRVQVGQVGHAHRVVRGHRVQGLLGKQRLRQQRRHPQLRDGRLAAARPVLSRGVQIVDARS
jgi:DMSO/TMAO reductase YedYZ molybdopterin-dependent catalytic subunit